jgi:hypothetical protein
LEHKADRSSLVRKGRKIFHILVRKVVGSKVCSCIRRLADHSNLLLESKVMGSSY